VLLFGC